MGIGKVLNTVGFILRLFIFLGVGSMGGMSEKKWTGMVVGLG